MRSTRLHRARPRYKLRDRWRAFALLIEFMMSVRKFCTPDFDAICHHHGDSVVTTTVEGLLYAEQSPVFMVTTCSWSRRRHDAVFWSGEKRANSFEMAPRLAGDFSSADRGERFVP
jgi:hypothetical protein